MKIVTYSEARNNLKSILDNVVENDAPTIVFRQRGDGVVMISKSHFDQIAASSYSSPAPAHASSKSNQTGVRPRGRHIAWGQNEARIVFDTLGYPPICLDFTELPQIDDVLAIKGFGVFKVVERGFCSGFDDDPPRFLKVEEIEGQNVAPGSGYQFLDYA